MFLVYVLYSIKEKKSYVGYTNNLKKRLEEHNDGKSFYTSRYRPWKVVYTEEHNTKEKALEREKYLKSKQGRRFLRDVVFK